MYNIKKQYTRPRPILYLYRGKPEVSLVSSDFNTAKEITLNQQMNEVSTLTFEIPFTSERKLSVDDCEKLIKFEGEYYIIKSIDTDDSETASMKVSCQHESTELKGIYCEYIDLIGATPKQMFDEIMNSTMHPVDTGYKWAGTDVDASKKRHLQTDSEQSVYQNLVSMAEVFNGWLDIWTDENEQKWIALRTNPIESKKWIKKGLDMRALNITYSSEEIFTRLYPLGESDSVTGEPLNIMGVNPTGKSYIENYSYYLAKGIPASVIDKEPKYQQLKTLNATDYTDANDLYQYALEELEKCCYPQLDATLTIDDLSVYVDSLDIPPKIGYNITCIDKEIDFILGCQITGVERDYDNPLETRITISNVVRYDTFFQKLEHSADTTDKIISSDEDGVYIPADKVKDGNHINVAYTLGNHTTQITENEEEIKLVASDVAGNKAELGVQAKKIESIVEDVAGNKTQITQTAKDLQSLAEDVSGNTTLITQNAKKIESLAKDIEGNKTLITQNANRIETLAQDIEGNKTQITQTAKDLQSLAQDVAGNTTKITQNAKGLEVAVSDIESNTALIRTNANEISQKVSKGSGFTSEMKQNVNAFQFLFEEASNSKTTIDRSGITITNGGFTIENKKGEEVLYCDSNGNIKLNHVWATDLYLDEDSSRIASSFWNVLYNMDSITLTGELKIRDRLTISASDFYINDGYDLNEYIDRRIRIYSQNKGWE